MFSLSHPLPLAPLLAGPHAVGARVVARLPAGGAARAFSRTPGPVDVRLDDTSIMRASGPTGRRTSTWSRGRLPQRLVDRRAAYIIDVASVDDASARRRGLLRYRRRRRVAAAVRRIASPLTRERARREVTTRTGLKVRRVDDARRRDDEERRRRRRGCSQSSAFNA